MKKSIIAFFFFTLCLTSKAQLDTASFDASFFVNLNSQQINLTSSNTATVSFSIQFYDTTYWDYKVALEHHVSGDSRTVLKSELKRFYLSKLI